MLCRGHVCSGADRICYKTPGGEIPPVQPRDPHALAVGKKLLLYEVI
jgi:hypothetical protein